MKFLYVYVVVLFSIILTESIELEPGFIVENYKQTGCWARMLVLLHYFVDKKPRDPFELLSIKCNK